MTGNLAAQARGVQAWVIRRGALLFEVLLDDFRGVLPREAAR